MVDCRLRNSRQLRQATYAACRHWLRRDKTAAEDGGLWMKSYSLLWDDGGAISFLVASKNTPHCSSYFFSRASILRARFRLEPIRRRSCTTARMIEMVTST